ncbi:hypothetical protein Glove_490g60 [Diversispora epigaea]|uniref:Uncharacterized protein n=1 Tax=Diversispora epigaea TaxID=1348612 RepID=A0A397GIQ8_9GLOM|nr:hypothetical protein Glove_490g60 [Diversispora epigaea]
MNKIRNRSIFTSIIAGLPVFTIPSTLKPTVPFVVKEEEEREITKKEITKTDSFDKKIDSLLKEQIDIKKRLKNIELLSEINNDLDFSKKNLKEEIESVIGKSLPDIYESMNLQYHSSLFKKIKTKLVIFEIFGESQLPHIYFQSFPAEINSWKSDQRVKDAYRKLFEVFSDNHIYMEIILDRNRFCINFKKSKYLKNPKSILGTCIEEITEEESEKWEEKKEVQKREESLEGVFLLLDLVLLDLVLLGLLLLGLFASSWLASPRVGSSRLFESSDTSDTTQEEGDTSDDTEGAKIVEQ